MNSYNENLHSSVVSSLNAQELELQKVQAQLDTSMFSLYYAQGARITAAEKLEIANRKYTFQQKIHEQAVIDSDVSTNVLASANNGKAYVGKSVTNTSVAAANVQIATNAILKLASDTGSIFSIVNAADFGTEIYQLSKEAKELMDKTAYLAERTSQYSMEASALIAEVSAPTLADKATTTDASVKNLLAVTTAQFDATAAEVAADNADLAATNTAEKIAEGTLEDVNAAYYATLGAYDLNNCELNLDLKVTLPKNVGDATHFKVSFDQYQSPFRAAKYRDGKAPLPKGYPVDNYYIMLAKYSKSTTFSISDAEGIVTDEDKNRYIEISAKKLNLRQKVSEEIYISELYDTDGDKMDLGEEYVVFVFAVLDTSYKKTLNTFDDYLSAPSAPFNLTNKLNKPKADTILVTDSKDKEQLMTFLLTQNDNYKVEYRCIFLPDNKKLVNGLLTVDELRSIEKETEGLEEISDKYDPKISAAISEINTLESELSGLDAQLQENLDAQQNSNITEAELKKLKAEEKKLKKSISDVNAKIVKEEANLARLEKQKKEAIEKMQPKHHIKPGFFFNLTTAEAISAGSYTVANIIEIDDKKDQTDYIAGEITLKPETTDNFGNRLINGNKYIPVVLAISNNTAEVNAQFTNALSAYQRTKSFIYNDNDGTKTLTY